MPYIATTTNVPISGKKQQVLKERLGQAIELIPGKTESWLMVSFQDNVPMYFKGLEDPCALLAVKIYGTATEEDYAKLTEALTDILREELDIDPDRVYVTYQEIDFWGWNGGNF